VPVSPRDLHKSKRSNIGFFLTPSRQRTIWLRDQRGFSMRAVILCLAMFVVGCGQSGPADKAKGKAAVPALTLAVTPLELTAKAALEKRMRDKRAA
jgi:hypothetical protein